MMPGRTELAQLWRQYLAAGEPGIWHWQTGRMTHQPVEAPPSFRQAQMALCCGLDGTAMSQLDGRQPEVRRWREAYEGWLASAVGMSRQLEALAVNDVRVLAPDGSPAALLRSPLHPLRVREGAPSALVVPLDPVRGGCYAGELDGWELFTVQEEGDLALDPVPLLRDYAERHAWLDEIVVNLATVGVLETGWLQPLRELAETGSQRWRMRFFVADDSRAALPTESAFQVSALADLAKESFPAHLAVIAGITTRRPALLPVDGARWKAHRQWLSRPRTPTSQARWQHHLPGRGTVATLADSLTAGCLAGQLTAAVPGIDVRVKPEARSLVELLRLQVDWTIVADPWVGAELFEAPATVMADAPLLLRRGTGGESPHLLSRLPRLVCDLFARQLAGCGMEELAEPLLLAARRLAPDLFLRTGLDGLAAAGTAARLMESLGVHAASAEACGTHGVRVLLLEDGSAAAFSWRTQVTELPSNARTWLIVPEEPCVCRQAGGSMVVIGGGGLRALCQGGDLSLLLAAWRKPAPPPLLYRRPAHETLRVAEERAKYGTKSDAPAPDTDADLDH